MSLSRGFRYLPHSNSGCPWRYRSRQLSISELGEVGRGHLPPLNLSLHQLLGRYKTSRFELVRVGRRLQRRDARLCRRGGLFRSLAPILARVVSRIRRYIPHARSILLDLVHEDFTVAETHIIFDQKFRVRER